MPRTYSPARRTPRNVLLSDTEAAFAAQLGGGNLSKGIRRALSTAHEYLTARGAEAIASPEEVIEEQPDFD